MLVPSEQSAGDRHGRAHDSRGEGHGLGPIRLDGIGIETGAMTAVTVMEIGIGIGIEIDIDMTAAVEGNGALLHTMTARSDDGSGQFHDFFIMT